MCSVGGIILTVEKRGVRRQTTGQARGRSSIRAAALPKILRKIRLNI
jgi:hypothetical protein